FSGAALSQDQLKDLVAGAYVLSVNGVGTATGNYSFRVTDLTSATTVTPGTPVQNQTLSPANAVAFYKFTAAPGQQLYFDSLGTTGGTVSWQLLDPFGNNVFGPLSATSDVERPVLAQSGTYFLLIEGAQSNTGTVTYSFNVQPTNDTTQVLTLNAAVNGNISVAGKRDLYTFSLAAPALLDFDAQTNDNQLQWSLVGPPGTVASAQGFTAQPGVLNLGPGAYTLMIDGTADHTAAYSFRLLDLAAAPTLTPGTPVTGALNPGNATDLYRFTATAGQQLYFDNRNLVGSANWRLVDPFGDNVFGPQFAGTDVERPIIRVTGTYVLAIEGNSSNTSAVNYTFNVQPITDTSHALTIGATTSGTITQTGQRDLYTFSVAAPTQVLFDGQTNDGQLQWSLVGPPGTEQSALAFVSTPSVLTLVPGSYTLTVDGVGDETTAYSFRLLDLAA